MSTPEETKKIMREALERQRDKALAAMSSSDQRIVNIATSPKLEKLEQVRANAQTAFRKALFWPTAQAIAFCAIIAVAFAFAFFAALNGQTPGPLIGPVTAISWAFALLSLAQFTYLIRNR